ncbi:hypothetical protein POTOM_001225 [Populus tomentosa]|uniref:Uncharacterized protein n=1 Tax=Populus tomentosa TaxID=118781 RepID=A0A8X8DHL1_POPTO|nr:hypothetical protein POTOM_001225 [Populus tomentosa]
MSIELRTSQINKMYSNADQEQLETLPMPSFLAGSYDPYRWGEYFGESGGHLHLVPRLRAGTNHQADVYGMRKDYSGWLAKCQVDLHVVVRTLFDGSLISMPVPNLRLLCVIRRESYDHDSLIVLQAHGPIIRFNTKDESFKASRVLGFFSSVHRWYIESCW